MYMHPGGMYQGMPSKKIILWFCHQMNQLLNYLVESGRPPEGDVEVIKSRMLSPRQYMDDLLLLLHETYGGAEGYIKNLGFNDSDIATIKEFLNGADS